MNVASLLEELTAWAGSRTDVAALALVGSHARGTARPDSDVDLVILCACPARLLAGNWLSLFGEIESLSVEDYGSLTALRVFYRRGLEVEFGVAERNWARAPLDTGTKRVLADGARALYDPEGLLEAAMAQIG